METTSSQPEFERVFHEYKSLVYSLAYRLTGRYDDAQDLFQDTMIKAWQNWDAVKDKEKPAKWLRTICTHTFIDQYRKDKIRPSALGTEFPRMDIDHPAATPLPEEELLADEQIRTVQHQCFTIMSTTLPLYQRIVFVLAHIFDVGLKETSIIINKSLPATKSLLSRARETMQDHYSPCCSLVSAENACHCRSWIDLQSDLHGKMEYIQFVVSRATSPDRITDAAREKVLQLFQNLPIMIPPRQWFEELSQKIG
jgi:RNA polymerase sigma factor (sigma-70 family)